MPLFTIFYPQLLHINIYSYIAIYSLVLPCPVLPCPVAVRVSTCPLLAQCGAAKSYIAMFSRALHVKMACTCSAIVATKLAKIKHTSLFVPSPAGFARAAVAAIGYEALSGLMPYSCISWRYCPRLS